MEPYPPLVKFGKPLGNYEDILEEQPEGIVIETVTIDLPAARPTEFLRRQLGTDLAPDKLKIRIQTALELGKLAFGRTLRSRHLTRMEEVVFETEISLSQDALTAVFEIPFTNDTRGFMVDKSRLQLVIQHLQVRREEAYESLSLACARIPRYPIWGKEGDTSGIWDFNEFEILAACFRFEVDAFLAHLADYHDFGKTQNHLLQWNYSSADNIVAYPITSVSTHQPASNQNERLGYSASTGQRPSIFVHPTTYNTSSRLRDLFPITSTPAGEPDPGDPGDNDDNAGGDNHGQRDRDNNSDPRRRIPRGNGDGGGGEPNPPPGTTPFSQDRRPANRVNVPQFDLKLKIDMIPEWDGNTDSISTWFTKINDLAGKSSILSNQLGAWVPMRLRGPAEKWYYSQSLDTRKKLESSWDNLRDGIAGYYMNRHWLDSQRTKAQKAKYREFNYCGETPSEYYIRKTELLKTGSDYSDRQLIDEVLSGAPLIWGTVLTPHIYYTAEEFQIAIKLQEKILLRYDATGQPFQFNDYSTQPRQNPRNPFNKTQARTNLVGWSKSTANPQYPKDDSIVSKNGTPESNNARPCRHCGSRKHWDYDCKYSRKGMKKVRTNMVNSDPNPEDLRALADYEDLYYNLISDDEDEVTPVMEEQDFDLPLQNTATEHTTKDPTVENVPSDAGLKGDAWGEFMGKLENDYTTQTYKVKTVDWNNNLSENLGPTLSNITKVVETENNERLD
ncbi:hypothetical protein BDQ17DRAFT_1244769 [Cyathus striatus]|nr:hypothetical protein BDQ17DRAFT_1244769 [Cyathus striatus]